ncbi:MAG: hypothetical protein R2702_01210 [Acidimicrobiales bacterium]
MPRWNRTDPDQVAQAYLASAALGALNTANAVRPLSRKGRASVLAFFPGWLTSELPLHAIGWQALASAAFVRGGALRRPKGWLALGLSLGSWAALAKVWKDSTRAGEVYAGALREGSATTSWPARCPTPSGPSR